MSEEQSKNLSPVSFLSSVFKYSIATWVNAVLYAVALVGVNLFLDKSVYGPYNLMIIASTTLMSAVALGLDHSYIRFYHEPPKGIKDSKQLASVCLTISVASLLILSLVMTVGFRRQLSDLFFESSEIVLLISMCVNTLLMLVVRFFNITYRMQNNVLMFTVVIILLQFFTRVFFLFGILVSPDLKTLVLFNLLGFGIAVLLLFLAQRKVMLPNKPVKISRESAKPLVRYGLGIAPSSILLMGNQLLSNFYVNVQLGKGPLGIFTYASTLSNVLVIIQGGFASYWSAFMFKHYKEEQKRIIRMHDYLMFVMMAMMCLILLVSPVVFLVLSNYAECRPIFGPMLFAPLLLIVGETTLYGIEIAKKTIFNTIGTALSFLTNVVLSIWLIPNYGLIGAVAALVASSVVMFLFRTIVAQRFYRTIGSYLKTAVSLLLVAGLSTASYLLDGQYLLVSFLSLGLLLLYCLIYRKEFLRLLRLAAEILRSIFKKKQPAKN